MAAAVSPIAEGQTIEDRKRQVPTCEVFIEHCHLEASRNRFLIIYDRLRLTLPTARVRGREGREGSFEVFIDDKIVYSKLRRKGYPNVQALLRAVARYSRTGRMPEKVPAEASCPCIVS